VADLSFIVFSEESDVGASLAKALEASGHAELRSIASDASELADAVRKHGPDALLVDLGHAPHGVLDLLDRLPAPRPLLVVCGPEDQSDVILRALKQGAREFLPASPEQDQVASAVQRLLLERGASLPRPTRSPLLAVMGAKGGVGATVVACQLAASLQAAGGRVVIVDLNYPLGDVALHFDVKPTYTLADIAPAADRLDASLLRGLLQAHRSGLQILAAPSRVEEAEVVKEEHVYATLEILRQEFDWVVADVSRSWNEASIRALDLASQILLVTSQDVPTLTHARAHHDLLLRLGHAPEKIHTLINRHSKRDAVSDDDVEQFLGVAPQAKLPNDYAVTATCVNEGRTITEVSAGSALGIAYQRLARQVHAWADRPLPESLNESARGLAKLARVLRRKD